MGVSLRERRIGELNELVLNDFNFFVELGVKGRRKGKFVHRGQMLYFQPTAEIMFYLMDEAERRWHVAWGTAKSYAQAVLKMNGDALHDANVARLPGAYDHWARDRG